MVSPVDKRKFDCYIPHPVEEAPEEVEDDPDLTPESLLSPLTQCLYRVEICLFKCSFFKLGGWWTYEFCPKKWLRQFHQEKDKPIRPQDDFILGRWDRQAGVIHDDYYSEEYTDGAVCDITGKPRTTQVRYRCSGDPSISLSEITEPSSCTYVLSVQLPQLCKYPAFRPADPKLQIITCIPEHDPNAIVSNSVNDLKAQFEAMHLEHLFSDDEDEELVMENFVSQVVIPMLRKAGGQGQAPNQIDEPTEQTNQNSEEETPMDFDNVEHEENEEDVF